MDARSSLWRPPSTAHDGSDQQRFRVTHPFHPLKDHEFELVGFSHTWGEYRVFFRKPADQRIYSLPAGWTDVGEPDAFVALSAGRSLFRIEDLLALGALIDELNQPFGVSQITPVM